MRYLGGKAQIAKELAEVLNHYRQGKPFLDAFCGSAAVAVALGGQGALVDAHPALIALYQAIAAGWDPPNTLSKDEWMAARALPMSNPLHGFAGFGCSFRGLYFSGYAGGYVGPASNPGAQAARSVLLRDIHKLRDRKCVFWNGRFEDIAVDGRFFLYCDPPYRGTTTYEGTPPIDYPKLYAQLQRWAKYTTVLVSEYDMPIGRVVWEKSRARKLKAGSGERALERLYLIGP